MREKVREPKAKRRETEFACRLFPADPARPRACPSPCAHVPCPVVSRLPAWPVLPACLACPPAHVVLGVVAALAGPCDLMTRQIPCKIIQPRARPPLRLPASRARSLLRRRGPCWHSTKPTKSDIASPLPSFLPTFLSLSLHLFPSRSAPGIWESAEQCAPTSGIAKSAGQSLALLLELA